MAPVFCFGGLLFIACLADFFRFYVSGLMKGGADVFVENLPGFPDNIRASSSGGYWVSMAAIRANPGFSMLDFLSERPFLKKVIFKVNMKTMISRNKMKLHLNCGFLTLVKALKILVLLMISDAFSDFFTLILRLKM